MGFRSLFLALYHGHQLNRVRRRERKHNACAKKLADARFADAKDCKQAQLTVHNGVVIGCIEDDYGNKLILRDNGEKLVLLLGQAGANKTTSVIIPTLLPTQRYGGLGHSAVVNDPAGEAYAVCKAALEAAGYRVVAITPCAALMSKKLGGLEVVDVGFDLWSDFKDAAPSDWDSMVVDKSELFIPDKPQDDAQTRFFNEAGRLIFQFLALYILAAGTRPTPAMLRSMAFDGEEGIRARCHEALGSDALDGELRQRATALLSTLERAPEEFSGGLNACRQALGVFFARGPLGAHFTGDGFDPRSLKDDQPTVAFVMYPTEKIRSHRRAVNATFSHIFEQLAADPRIDKQVTHLIDECSALGYLPTLANAITEYRKFSQRFVLAFQQFSGQCEKHYGSAIVSELRGSSAILWGANIRETSDLDMFSKYSGTVTVEVSSKHDPTSEQARSVTGQSFTQSHRERPLLRSEDVRLMPDDEVLIVHSNLPMIRARKTCYWKFPLWKSIAAPNPYQKD